jgi:hypothetical protein
MAKRRPRRVIRDNIPELCVSLLLGGVIGYTQAGVIGAWLTGLSFAAVCALLLPMAQEEGDL